MTQQQPAHELPEEILNPLREIYKILGNEKAADEEPSTAVAILLEEIEAYLKDEFLVSRYVYMKWLLGEALGPNGYVGRKKRRRKTLTAA